MFASVKALDTRSDHNMQVSRGPLGHLFCTMSTPLDVNFWKAASSYEKQAKA